MIKGNTRHKLQCLATVHLIASEVKFLTQKHVANTPEMLKQACLHTRMNNETPGGVVASFNRKAIKEQVPEV